MPFLIIFSLVKKEILYSSILAISAQVIKDAIKDAMNYKRRRKIIYKYHVWLWLNMHISSRNWIFKIADRVSRATARQYIRSNKSNTKSTLVLRRASTYRIIKQNVSNYIAAVFKTEFNLSNSCHYHKYHESFVTLDERP